MGRIGVPSQPTAQPSQPSQPAQQSPTQPAQPAQPIIRKASVFNERCDNSHMENIMGRSWESFGSAQDSKFLSLFTAYSPFILSAFSPFTFYLCVAALCIVCCAWCVCTPSSIAFRPLFSPIPSYVHLSCRLLCTHAFFHRVPSSVFGRCPLARSLIFPLWPFPPSPFTPFPLSPFTLSPSTSHP